MTLFSKLRVLAALLRRRRGVHYPSSRARYNVPFPLGQLPAGFSLLLNVCIHRGDQDSLDDGGSGDARWRPATALPLRRHPGSAAADAARELISEPSALNGNPPRDSVAAVGRGKEGGGVKY